jgi:hypothetical protein
VLSLPNASPLPATAPAGLTLAATNNPQVEIA